MKWIDNLLIAAEVPTLHPNAQRSILYISTASVVLFHNILPAIVVGLWARGAIIWTAPYKLYAALAFWILWQLPRSVVEGIKTANRLVPKCPCCDPPASPPQ